MSSLGSRANRAKQQGVEVDLLLRRAGLTRQQIDDPRLVSPSKVRSDLSNLPRRPSRTNFSDFIFAQKFDLRMGGLFHYVLASSDTLGEALQRGARYSSIVNEGITLRLREAKGIRNQFRICRGFAAFRPPSDRVFDGDPYSHMPTIDKSSLAGQPGEFHSSTER